MKTKIGSTSATCKQAAKRSNNTFRRMPVQGGEIAVVLKLFSPADDHNTGKHQNNSNRLQQGYRLI